MAINAGVELARGAIAMGKNRIGMEDLIQLEDGEAQDAVGDLYIRGGATPKIAVDTCTLLQ